MRLRSRLLTHLIIGLHTIAITFTSASIAWQGAVSATLRALRMLGRLARDSSLSLSRSACPSPYFSPIWTAFESLGRRRTKEALRTSP